MEGLEQRLLFHGSSPHEALAASAGSSPALTNAPDRVAAAATEPGAGTGIVEGHAFLDANANGKRARRDLGLFNQTIYLDADDDGVLDVGETSTATDASGLYRLNVPEGNHVLRQHLWKKLLPSQPIDGGRAISVTGGQTLVEVDFGSYLAHPDIIDVMVLYTPSARLGAGGQSAIRALIKDSVADANAIFATSRVNAALRLVHRDEVSYDDSGSLDRDLTRLANRRDGHMNEIHDLRNEHDADLVSLFVDFGEDADGIAYILDRFFPDPDELGFSVIRQEEAVATEHVFTHEIGHNLGASHDRENADTDGSFDYSFAHRFTIGGVTYRTLMAYAPGKLLPVFSNPKLKYQGEPLGVPTAGWGESDNAKTLRKNMGRAAAFRDGDMAGNSRSKARVVGEVLAGRREIYRESVGRDDKRDLYRIRVTEPATVDATLKDLSANANLHLLNNRGDTVASSRTKGTAREKIRVELGTGTYFLRVPSLAGKGSTNYTLVIRGDDIPPQQIAARKVARVVPAADLFGTGSIGIGDEEIEPLTSL